MATSKRKSGPVKDIYAKLASLLRIDTHITSADVIDEFGKKYQEDWKKLQSEYGDRDDAPGHKTRGKHYAASTYLADRLSTMKRMGLVELKYTLDFDQVRWRHNRRMGTWRLLKMPTWEANETFQFVTVRLAQSTYDQLLERVGTTGTSVAACAAEIISSGLQPQAPA